MAESQKSLWLEGLKKDAKAASRFGLINPMNFWVLTNQPVCVVLTPEIAEPQKDLGSSLIYFARKLSNSDLEREFLFRGVKLERLESVVSSGCDVIPTTDRIFATDSPNKALEYGEVVMVFDANKLEKTFVEVPKSESAENLDRLRSEYPTELEMGENLWFSKLPPKDFRVGTAYEGFYSYYIPGDAREALLMVFLVGNDKQWLLSEYTRLTNKPLPPDLQAEHLEWEQKQADNRARQAAILEKARSKRHLGNQN